ncbi:MAG TPA: hypothetical protein VLJ76_06650 [Gaiellaceae bacterium]|nr:hypothetical protein [Gaiellaceae bacterium]
MSASRVVLVAGGLLLAALGGAASAARPVPTPIGVTPGYRLPASSAAVRAARTVGSFACSAATPRRFRVHLELFARRLVLIVPAGIGISPPLRRDGAFVLGGRCTYPLRTREPTGVVEVGPAGPVTVGDLFRVWGQPLSARRLAGFRSASPVQAFVNGRRVTGDPRAIPLRQHDEIVLEIGGYVPPHTSYLFPKGTP